MLGRTANDLFWMSRYIDGPRTSLACWRSAIASRSAARGSRSDEEWPRRCAAPVARRVLAKYGLRDTQVVNSCCSTGHTLECYSCLATADAMPGAANGDDTRGGRAQQRVAGIFAKEPRPGAERLPPMLDWIKERSALFRGALLNTIYATTRSASASSAPSSSAPTNRAHPRVSTMSCCRTTDRRRRDRQRAVGAILRSVSATAAIDGRQ